jgi:perosamine synthetase
MISDSSKKALHTIEFIRDMYKSNSLIPLHEPKFIGNEREYVMDAIDSTFVSSVGAYVDRFERKMEEITGTERAVAVVNGTAGLHTALILAGVGVGDEVLTQSLTFIATCNAIAYCKAQPVFIDVDLDTLGLSPKNIEHFLAENAELRDGNCYNKKTGNRIKCCLPMHTFGLPCRIDKIAQICKVWGIVLIEDAAESIGATYKNKPTGSFGTLGVFSFNGNKIVTCGGGGAVVTNLELGKKGKHITTVAKVPHAWEYGHDQIGYNYRMPNLNAALACAQLERLNDFLLNKRETAMKYKAFFDDMDIEFIDEIQDAKANFWLTAILLSDRKERDYFLQELNSNKVMSRPVWTPMDRLPIFSNCLNDGLENTNYLADRIVNIPSSFNQY